MDSVMGLKCSKLYFVLLVLATLVSTLFVLLLFNKYGVYVGPWSSSFHRTAIHHPPQHVLNKRLDTGLTSHILTDVMLVAPKESNITVGDIIKYQIHTRDLQGRERTTGGDFYFATLSSGKNARTAGNVVDHGNGTYDVHLLAACAGSARLDLILVHTSKTVQFWKNSVWNEYDRIQWIGKFIQDGKTVETRCVLRTSGALEGACEYPAYHALGTTMFVCERKPTVSCKSLVSYRINWKGITETIYRLAKGNEFLFERPFFLQPMNHATGSLVIKGSNVSPRIELPRCKPDQRIPDIQGFWKDGLWVSLLCKFSKYTNSMLKTCLKDKQIILLGGSTTLRWGWHLLDIFGKPTKQKKNKGGPTLWWRTYFDKLKLNMYFQFHPHILGGQDFFKIEDMRNEVDVLDGLNNKGCGYIVAISPWAHFTVWRRDDYIMRVAMLREAVIRFKQRCPNSPVVIKGPHAGDFSTFLPKVMSPDYSFKEIEKINQEGFYGTGAFFLPVWDLTLAHQSPNNIHMPVQVVIEEVKMFLGYVCDK